MWLQEKAADTWGVGGYATGGTVGVDYYDTEQTTLCEIIGLEYERWYIVRVSISYGGTAVVDAVDLYSIGVERGKPLADRIAEGSKLKVTVIETEVTMDDLFSRSKTKGVKINLDCGNPSDFYRGDFDEPIHVDNI